MSTVKLFVVVNENNMWGKLTKFFTGCYAYHIGFAVPDSDAIYDMSFLFRKRKLSGTYDPDRIVFFDLPEGVSITERELEEEVFEGVRRLCHGDIKASIYGYFDYLAFGFRKIYHLFGKSTPNFGGQICSEKVESMLEAKGWTSSFVEVPSPCDFVNYFKFKE